ncbi:hypothetical protein GCG54_00005221 [Colletotrichum gloeosporioides]|uniref:SnoaL-like domain-containing protein n=1 Tax=Colletotrichum gloeosporioides TaxID=474922 RepID=A0A8H4C579_COLGL|nr:uncharacterized protein GCG54_00005221 [Colletotrichum gloeosporioides]KAF3797467.1 hypothetical protein GCG54_00005221 [Colletotrichum gloeosporioides]
MVTENEITTMFEPLARGDMASFLANIEPDVDWTVKAAFQEGTKPLSATWAGPLHLEVQNIIVSGNQAAVELKAVKTRIKNGQPFPNEYTWILGFNEKGKVATVRAYMDTDLVTRVIDSVAA